MSIKDLTMTTHKLTTKAIAKSATTYVGRTGEIFYDTAIASLKLSDGATAGGVSFVGGAALGYVSSSFGVTSTSAGATTSDGKLYFGLLPFISSTQSGVTISAPLGNINGVWTITVYVGGSATSSRTANPSIGSGTVNASSTRLANIGDYAVMIFQDLTNNHLYQVTTAISAISLNASSGTTVIQQLV
jgi:hypothetical protein